MGQRLVVNFIYKTELIANCYYHWSAYTTSAAQELERFFEGYRHTNRKYKGIYDPRLHVIRSLMYVSEKQKEHNRRVERLVELSDSKYKESLQNFGARFTQKESTIAKAEYPGVRFASQEKASRSNGLICISPEEMANSDSYAEGSVTVLLDESKILFPIFGETYRNYSEYVKGVSKYKPKADIPKEKDIPFFGIKRNGRTVQSFEKEIRFAHFRSFLNVIYENKGKCVRTESGRIMTFI